MKLDLRVTYLQEILRDRRNRLSEEYLKTLELYELKEVLDGLLWRVREGI